jgi:hypothetical protein
MKLASHIQQLRHYLSAYVTTLPEGGLQPVDFADFGFSSVAEIMDLYSGVSDGRTGLSSDSLLFPAQRHHHPRHSSDSPLDSARYQ